MKKVKSNMILSMAAIVAMAALTGCGDSSDGQPQAASAQEWYVSTTVSVHDSGKTYTGVNPAVFGKLAESSDGFDKHDIPTIGSVVNRKAAVVFIHSDWEDLPGEYHSNYYNANGDGDSWEMTVFSSRNAEVTLKWNGLYELTAKEGQRGWDEKKVLNSSILEELHLVDTTTSEVIDAVTNGKLNTYTFNMGDVRSRTFRWVEGAVDTASVTASSATTQYIQSKQKEEAAKAAALSSQKAPSALGFPPSM